MFDLSMKSKQTIKSDKTIKVDPDIHSEVKVHVAKYPDEHTMSSFANDALKEKLQKERGKKR